MPSSCERRPQEQLIPQIEENCVATWKGGADPMAGRLPHPLYPLQGRRQ